MSKRMAKTVGDLVLEITMARVVTGQSQSLKRTLSAIIVEKLVITRRIVIFGRRRKAKAKRDLVGSQRL